MGNYKVLKKLRPNIEYAEILRKVASKIANLEEPITNEMVEQIKELSKKAIKLDEEEKIKQENSKKDLFITAMKIEAEKRKEEEKNIESFDGNAELRSLAEKAQIHPMLPTKYNAIERAKLKEFERELLTGSKDKSIKPKIDIER